MAEEKPISLNPLNLREALAGAMKVKPPAPPKKAKAAAKKPKKK